MAYLLMVVATALCAFMAIRARHLIMAALWLAGASALVSIVLYASGAHIAAVIELSVGAGLVTVLFVFAISIAGDDALHSREFVSNSTAITLMLVFLGLLGWMVLPVHTTQAVVDKVPFADVLWHDRALDTLAQLILIFTGVLCLLGLMTEDKTPIQAAEIEEATAQPQGISSNATAPVEAITPDHEREKVLA